MHLDELERLLCDRGAPKFGQDVLSGLCNLHLAQYELCPLMHNVLVVMLLGQDIQERLKGYWLLHDPRAK